MQPGAQVSHLSISELMIFAELNGPSYILFYSIGLRDGKKNSPDVTLLISLPFHNVRIIHKKRTVVTTHLTGFVHFFELIANHFICKQKFYRYRRGWKTGLLFSVDVKTEGRMLYFYYQKLAVCVFWKQYFHDTVVRYSLMLPQAHSFTWYTIQHRCR